MVLKSLSLSSFRNFGRTEIHPGPRFNVFHGKNGQGKTNVLEAVFLLGAMKSFRHARNPDLIRWGEPFALLKGTVQREGSEHEVSLLIETAGKKARIDRKALVRLADFFGRLNVVVFSPDELGMVRGMPEARRRYLDRAVFGRDPGYLLLHQEYSKVLRNRNALLKRGDTAGLDVWNERLVETAARVVEKRVEYLTGISKLLPPFYAGIAGREDGVSLSYRPHLLAGIAEAEYRERLLALLERLAGEERRKGTTLAGPHRDDLELTLSGKPVRQHASQGEQRSFVLALKMAEIELLHREHGDPPVLLLDDMASELDRERNGNLMHFLEEKGMQVFITTTALENLNIHATEKYRTFLVREGTVTG
jgi:DNA replication and repair protein RecF